MEAPLADLSFLYDLADNDTNYINDVVTLYLGNVTDGMANLKRLANETDDFSAIQRQAHSLKSSAGIIKVRGMYDNLVAIEDIARNNPDTSLIKEKINNILSSLDEALPLIRKVQADTKPVKIKA